MQIIISAGGTGTRLWPLSTSRQPKQFSPIIDEQTLIKKTYNRLVKQIPIKNIWISTNEKYIDWIEKCIPGFDPAKIIVEPAKKDTFAATCANAAIVASRTSRDETIINIQADAFIHAEDEDQYLQALHKIDLAITQGEFDMMTLAIKPFFPNIGLGYLEVDAQNKESVFENPALVTRFTEKPTLEIANKFIEQGNYFWHWGTYSFTFNKLIEQVSKLQPESLDLVEKIFRTSQIDFETYNQFPKMALEFAITEKLKSLGVLALDIFWDDIGTWKTVYNYLPNLHEHTALELAGSGNKIKSNTSGRKVAFVGVSDLLLVETEEGILVINPEMHAEVKKVAEYFDKGN